MSNEDEILSIDPEAANSPHLKLAGDYGIGRDNGGEAEVFDLEWPVERELKPETFPNPPYVQWVVKVTHPEYGICFTRCFPQSTQPNTGAKSARWLENLGVPFENKDGRLEFRKSDVVGIKCAVKVKGPRTGNDGVTRTGDIVEIMGA